MNLLKMRRRILIVFLITAIIIVGINLRNKKRRLPLSPKKVSQKMKQKEKNSGVLFTEADKYYQEEELLKARESYEKIIKDYSGSEIAEKAEAKLGETNIKILFSPLCMEGSKVYKVQPGDNLTLIAKKFGTTLGLIKKSNNLQSDAIYPKQKLKIPLFKFSIFVDKSDNVLILKADDKVLKKYRVSTGKNNSTPVGEFEITSNRLVNPVWYFEGKAVSPQSPDNVLGSRWLGLSVEGYGIHGTTDPESVGRQITRGCVRMLNNDVEELYTIVPTGTKVVIKD